MLSSLPHLSHTTPVFLQKFSFWSDKIAVGSVGRKLKLPVSKIQFDFAFHMIVKCATIVEKAFFSIFINYRRNNKTTLCSAIEAFSRHLYTNPTSVTASEANSRLGVCYKAVKLFPDALRVRYWGTVEKIAVDRNDGDLFMVITGILCMIRDRPKLS